MNAVLPHPTFQRPPIACKRRRGRLPRNVVHIKRVPRLQVGVLAEVFDRVRPVNNGKRVRVTGFDPNTDGYHFDCTSLDGAIQCDDSTFATMLSFKPGELRRAWTDLSENDRIKLRLWRGAP